MAENIHIPNYSVSVANTQSADRRLLIIKNTDGTIRWAWPASSNKPLFLKFYNAGSKKAALISFVFKLIFRFRLQRIIFQSIPSSLLSNYDWILGLDLSHDRWALFTGTVGPNNKSLLYLETEGEGQFIKIASTNTAKDIIANEHASLIWLKEHAVNSFRFPEVLSYTEDSLTINDIADKSGRGSTLTEHHIKALSELIAISKTEKQLVDIKAWQEAISDIHQLEEANDPRIPKGLLRKLKALYESIQDQPINLALSHGDFTAWNMYVSKDGLSIYDWELSRDSMPFGFDAFHFLVQQGILVERKPWSGIKADIQRSITVDVWHSWTQDDQLNPTDYLKLYLIINVANYLKIYNEQPIWHEQVTWLLETWNVAISDMLEEVPNRKLIIEDVFVFLNNRNYTTLKFHEAAPSELSEYSDIDLCLSKQDAKALEDYLKNHPLAASVHMNKKSFMQTIHMFLKDGGIVSLDLIWKLKRRSRVMMDVKKMIGDAKLNIYGVKQPDEKSLAQFIGLFYFLNHSPIPEKYQPLMETLTESNDDLDTLLTAIMNGSDGKTKLHGYLDSQKPNRGLSRFMNKMDYIRDTLKDRFMGHGMIVTFSGVDGAGKSTMIQLVKTELEKRLRRKVVVLRHRPSLLPILSTWVMGKEQAEQAAISQLPHSGRNKSFISSLLRFSYYYLDYIIGQFYVHLRYVMSNHVVLYDRYYFDFINDSRRSNIQLPQRLTKAGYALLMEPDLNFFLYADPAVILERKREIDAPTINKLTKDYKDLFNQLSTTHKAGYHAVENVNISNTLEIIMSHFNAKITLS